MRGSKLRQAQVQPALAEVRVEVDKPVIPDKLIETP